MREVPLWQVADLHRAAKARSVKFGEEYAPPRLKVLLSPTEFRKYMSATAGCALCPPLLFFFFFVTLKPRVE